MCTAGAARNLRHTILREDVRAAARALVEEEDTFTEGLFRENRVKGAEEVLLWRICRYSTETGGVVDRALIEQAAPAMEPTIVARGLDHLAELSIIKRPGKRIQLCSPLVGMWLTHRFDTGRRIISDALRGQFQVVTLRYREFLGLDFDRLWRPRFEPDVPSPIRQMRHLIQS